MEPNQLSMLVVTGPTASGKTKRAVDLARHFGGEIISADSRQVYKGMDLGSGKDLCEYGSVPYHLIDIVPAGTKYNLFRFLHDATEAVNDIKNRHLLPIVCGGTGLYVESLLKGLSLPKVPENKEFRNELEGKSLEELTAILSKMKVLHNTTDIDTAKRAIRAIEIQKFYLENPDPAAGAIPNPIKNAVIIGVDISREDRRKRISDRLEARIDAGMIAEIERLIAEGIHPDDLIYYGLEYKYLTLHVLGKLTREEMISQLEIAIHQFSKRQMTWFRGMERRGFKINWIPWNIGNDEFVCRVDEIISETPMV